MKINPLTITTFLFLAFSFGSCDTEDSKELTKEEYLKWFQSHRDQDLGDITTFNHVTYKLNYLPEDLNKLSEYKHYNFQLEIKVTPQNEWYNKHPFSRQEWVEFGLKGKNKNRFILIDSEDKKYRPKDVYFEFNQVNTNLAVINLFFDVEEQKKNKWRVLFDETIFSNNIIEFELKINELPHLII